MDRRLVWLVMMCFLVTVGVTCDARDALALTDGMRHQVSWPGVYTEMGDEDLARWRAERSDMLAFDERGDFSEAALAHGVRAEEVQCRRVASAVWVPATPHRGECLRYWAAGFREPSAKARAVVFFPGDPYTGPGMTSRSYLSLTPESLQRSADEWSMRLGTPFIFFGRPGTFGSSGDQIA
jgi:hypothetical protein